jgi:hypothetical protein
MHKKTERPRAMRMMAPSTAPTIAAIGAECAWFVGAGAAADVAVLNMLCVTVAVMKAVGSGCTRLTVKLSSVDGLEDDEASVLMVVDAGVDAVAVGKTVLVVLDDADEICDGASEAVSH